MRIRRADAPGLRARRGPGQLPTRCDRKGVDQPISELLGAAYPGRPALSRNIAVGHLLTKSSGPDRDDFDEASPGHQKNMYPTQDWVNFILTLSQRSTPGTVSRYCTGAATTMGRAVSEASGLSVPAFAEQHLLAPPGIKTMKWVTYDNGRHSNAGGLAWLRPRDMAKFGQMVLQNGLWEGRQIVSEEWIAQATRTRTTVSGAREGGLPLSGTTRASPMNGRRTTSRGSIPSLGAVIVAGDSLGSDLVRRLNSVGIRLDR